jgi:hypothetical protein
MFLSGGQMSKTPGPLNKTMLSQPSDRSRQTSEFTFMFRPERVEIQIPDIKLIGCVSHLENTTSLAVLPIHVTNDRTG